MISGHMMEDLAWVLSPMDFVTFLLILGVWDVAFPQHFFICNPFLFEFVFCFSVTLCIVKNICCSVVNFVSSFTVQCYGF